MALGFFHLNGVYVSCDGIFRLLWFFRWFSVSLAPNGYNVWNITRGSWILTYVKSIRVWAQGTKVGSTNNTLGPKTRS